MISEIQVHTGIQPVVITYQVLGQQNLRMIQIARSVGAAAKFTGSGGAAIVLCPGGQEQVVKLSHVATREGFSIVEVQIAPAVQR